MFIPCATRYKIDLKMCRNRGALVAAGVGGGGQGRPSGAGDAG